MGTLEQINDLKNQGIPENEIISELKQRGISPKEINEALNQSRIKNAVTGEGAEQNVSPSSGQPHGTPRASRTQEVDNSDEYYSPSEVQPSQEYYPQQNYEPPPQNYTPPQNYSAPQQEQYYEEYPQYSGEGYGEGYSNTDDFIEIAEQVFSQKIKEIDKKIDELNEIKSIAGIRLDHMSERVKRMESAFDKLQAAILNKIGSYGNTLGSIKKEMEMLGNSFSKITGTRTNSPSKKKAPAKKSSTKKKKSKKTSSKRKK